LKRKRFANRRNADDLWDGGCAIPSIYGYALQEGHRAVDHRDGIFVAFVFLPADTWHYWQGWFFITVFSASTIGVTVYHSSACMSARSERSSDTGLHFHNADI
jgi:hypothetical protein